MKAEIQLTKEQVDKVMQDEVNRLSKLIKSLEKKLDNKDKKIRELEKNQMTNAYSLELRSYAEKILVLVEDITGEDIVERDYC
tara:strand:- start:322 stop:570 length:249 start_codon:yes stop_codon:yes gene_type:complete